MTTTHNVNAIAWHRGKRALGRHALFSNARKLTEVRRKEAPGRHTGAYPYKARLLLRVYAQHVPALPHVIILRALADCVSRDL